MNFGRRLFGAIGTFVIVLGILATPSLLQGQASASINGTVTDVSGAVVPDAEISVSNEATNATRATRTDSTGTYSVSSLPPGKYDITVTKAGLKTVKFEAVTLTVDQALTLDAKLEVSSASVTVTVEGTDIAPIDTTDSPLTAAVTATTTSCWTERTTTTPVSRAAGYSP